MEQHRRVAVVYTASTIALAFLETRVHLRRMPTDYVLLVIEIGDELVEPGVTTAELHDPRFDARRIGDEHFRSRPLLPLCVPSVVAVREFNVLFSPAYAAAHARVLEVESVRFDPRLWL